ncbi:MAG: hypothetical protein ACXW07_08025 [Nitrososphaeraceae archaeon]
MFRERYYFFSRYDDIKMPSFKPTIISQPYYRQFEKGKFKQKPFFKY